MTAILFDSRTSRKPSRFAHGLRAIKPCVFEPSAADRQWAARDYADRCERTSAELNAIERTAARIGNRLEETRVALKKVEKVLNDEPTDHDIDAWADYGAWCARMQDAYDGLVFEPSTPISDEDINNVNVAG